MPPLPTRQRHFSRGEKSLGNAGISIAFFLSFLLYILNLCSNFGREFMSGGASESGTFRVASRRNARRKSHRSSETRIGDRGRFVERRSAIQLRGTLPRRRLSAVTVLDRMLQERGRQKAAFRSRVIGGGFRGFLRAF